MIKDGKLSTIFIFENQFQTNKIFNLDMNIENQFKDCVYQHIDFSQKWTDIITHQEARTERICKNSMRNENEDEEHFIIRCKNFIKEREELFELISSEVN